METNKEYDKAENCKFFATTYPEVERIARDRFKLFQDLIVNEYRRLNIVGTEWLLEPLIASETLRDIAACKRFLAIVADVRLKIVGYRSVTIGGEGGVTDW